MASRCGYSGRIKDGDFVARPVTGRIGTDIIFKFNRYISFGPRNGAAFLCCEIVFAVLVEFQVPKNRVCGNSGVTEPDAGKKKQQAEKFDEIIVCFLSFSRFVSGIINGTTRRVSLPRTQRELVFDAS